MNYSEIIGAVRVFPTTTLEIMSYLTHSQLQGKKTASFKTYRFRFLNNFVAKDLVGNLAILSFQNNNKIIISDCKYNASKTRL